MNHEGTLAALRRHLARAPEARRHTPFPGGIRFEDGDRIVTATDLLVFAALAEIESERSRRRRFERLLAEPQAAEPRVTEPFQGALRPSRSPGRGGVEAP